MSARAIAPTTSADLATALVDDVGTVLDDLRATLAPGLRPPAVIAGHPVDAAAVSDLVFTLGLLTRLGVTEVGDVGLADHTRELIAGLDSGMVEAFASYRVGETALALGAGDPDGDWGDDEVHHVGRCVDTSGTIGAVREGLMPPNYSIVVARCLAAQRALTGEMPSEWAEFLEASEALLDTSTGWIDDGPGELRHFDIYSPDMYLFAEPLADDIGPAWTDGLRRLLVDLDDLVLPGGTIVWGRSVGALSLAMTVELAAVGTRRSLLDNPATWLERADQARRTLLADWFDGGLISAHRHRSTMFYRGPERRLQMTLDILGKLAAAALELRAVVDTDPPAPPDQIWPSVDRLVVGDTDGPGAVWAHRGRHLQVVLPIMHGWASDYLPSPRAPGSFEVPTSGHPCLLPVAHRGSTVLVPAGIATEVVHRPDGLVTEHSNWAPVGQAGDGPDAVNGRRRATYEVQGRSLVVSEELQFGGDLPDTVSITVAEPDGRPLSVTAELMDAGGDSALPVQQVVTEGLAEWRSFWSPLPRVHQFEIPAGPARRVRWSVTPHLVVADTIAGHPYSDELYRPLLDRLVRRPAPLPDGDFARKLADVDVFHLAWPEWWTGVDPEWTEQVIEAVQRSGTPIVWTQHNLTPHADRSDDAAACYQLWSEAADAVIHHSVHGRDVVLDAYRHRPDTVHPVIPHGHWGRRHDEHPFKSRDLAEAENDWPPCAIRLGVIGSPRLEKDVQGVLDGFAATDRDDLQLIVRTGEEHQVPDDPRVFAERAMTDDGRYVRRLAGFDALILPFASAGMLTTGTAFDAIGAGLAAITSDWSFFDETFEGADIRYGWGADDLADCLQALTHEEIDRSAAAIAARRPGFEWADLARQTLDVFETVAAR